MDNDLERPSTMQDKQTAEDKAVTGTSRRRFTRSAVLGGAVVFSLGNRAAWSNAVCVSEPTMLSYAAGIHSSMSANTISQVEEYQAALQGENMVSEERVDAQGKTQFCAVQQEVEDPPVVEEPEKCYNGRGSNPSDLPPCP